MWKNNWTPSTNAFASDATFWTSYSPLFAASHISCPLCLSFMHDHPFNQHPHCSHSTTHTLTVEMLPSFSELFTLIKFTPNHSQRLLSVRQLVRFVLLVRKLKDPWRSRLTNRTWYIATAHTHTRVPFAIVERRKLMQLSLHAPLL